MDAKEKIEEALWELLKHQGFDNITVSMICKRAQVSRPTFYAYFADKYDLVTVAYEKEISKFLQYHSWRKILITSLSYLRNHQAYIRPLLDYHGQNSFVSFLLSYTKKCTKQILVARGAQMTKPELQYGLSFYTFGVCYTLIDWLKNGCHDSPQKFTEMMSIEMPDVLKRYLLQ